MYATVPFAFIFRLSQFFGIFPFGLRKSNGVQIVEESRKVLAYTKTAIFFFGLVGCYYTFTQCYVSFNLAPQGSSRVVWLSSNLSLSLSGFMVFHPILKHRRAFHYWLNKIPEVFSILKEGSLRKTAAIYYCSFAEILSLLIAAFVSEVIVFEITYQDWLFISLYVTILSFYLLLFEIKIFLQLFCVFINLIRFYYSDTQDFLKSGGKPRDKQSWLGFLREFRLKDLDVKDFVDFLHSFFIPAVSLQILCAFFNFLLHVSLASKKIGPPFYIQALWAVFVFWDTLLIAGLCQTAENEGERTIHCLHELFINWDDKELRKEVDLLSLQLQHRRLEFTALGCQRLNFSLVYWMVGLLASYAVIMAQFHFQPTSGKTSVL